MGPNRLLTGLCGVLLVGSLGGYFAFSEERTDAISNEALQHMTRIRCGVCHETYQIPFAEAEKLARDAAETGKSGFRCAKCGQETAWIQPSMDMSGLGPLPQSVIDASIDRRPTRIDDASGEPVETAPAPKTGSVWAPNPAGRD